MSAIVNADASDGDDVQVASLTLRRPIYCMAPMVGQSDRPFRLLCRRHGTTLCYSEMLMADEFAASPAYRLEALGDRVRDHPLIVQFAANEADAFAPGVVFVPSRRFLAELAAWLSFVPFMSVDLRADVDSRVFATDASSRTCAAVVSELPEELCREIWRQRPRRGVGQSYVDTLERDVAEARADDEDDADDDADDDVSASDSDADCQLARSTWSAE